MERSGLITKQKARSRNSRRAPGPETKILALPPKILSVPFSKAFPFLRQVVQRKNCRHRADRHTGSAVDTFNRVDVQHFLFRVRRIIFLWMDTIHRASVDTRGVFGADARFCDYVGHKL